ncbi:uncharacterized protein ATC70_011860 [Mucor velutinosus]|uniref:Uncharacterized protein n=1 Tax=Mucor velutinosus TaxID=708070 RepID=A0AAN7HZB0_9FUNG|nr:hypothetical protein ATC70_011860 [Mucor velutinosus]
MAATASKSVNPFAQQRQWNYQLEDSCLPKFYEQDVHQSQRTTFRSVSPKMYNQQKMDYFSDINDELEMADNEDSLYEATLMNANFLSLSSSSPCIPVQDQEKPSGSLSRLRQILGHINPNYVPESLALPDITPAPSVRSQFSAASSSSLFQQQHVQQQTTHTSAMRAFSISDPRDPKGKGKSRSTL